MSIPKKTARRRWIRCSTVSKFTPVADDAWRILEPAQWRSRQERHHERVDALVSAHKDRQARRIKHPIEDFLFEYYSFRPSHLRRWHPGVGLALRTRAEASGGEYASLRHYRTFGAAGGLVGVDVESVLGQRRRTIHQIENLLTAVAGRDGQFGCFGMHEWAMVMGSDPDQLRHRELGLRLSAEQTAEVVQRNRLVCSHIDAVRFFTPSAGPLNELVPTRETQAAFDQPGCVHVGMDLYKWAAKLSPLAPSELIVDCFELARELRVLDMRASPYDVTSMGYTPICVETPSGKAAYVAEQRRLAKLAAPLRERILDVCRRSRLSDGVRGLDLTPSTT